ncbi:MAG: ABC transporter substrate-binding protein [Symbiobacteriia bacterium]
MRRFFAFLVVLLLLFSLLEPVLPPPAVPAWPGRVTASETTRNAMTRPAEDDSAGRLRSAPPDQPVCREGLLQPPPALMPLLPGWENPVTRLLFRALARLDEAGRPAPDLAAGWVHKGGTGWTVRLQPGLRWHDGEAVTARDVVFTFTAAAHPSLQELPGAGAAAGQVRRRARLWASRRVEALDDLTVRITLDQPDASLPYDLTLPLLPAHLLAATPNPQDWAASDFAAAPVGTGFFRWAGEADGAISLTAFQQAGLWPRQAGYRFVALGSAAEAWQALRSGKLDGVTFDLPPAVGDTPAGLLKQRAARLQLQSDSVPGTQALLLLWSTASDAPLRRLVAPVLAARAMDPQPASSGRPADLDQLGWTAGVDGWRHRGGRILQVLVDLSAGSGESLPLLQETAAALVRPLRDLGIQVVLANRATSKAEREAVTLAARLVLWDGGADPDLANLVAALPDVDADLIRQASLPRQTLDDEERLARLGALAARLQDEALVTPLARSWRISVSRQRLRAGVEKRRGEGEGAGA